MEGKIVEGFKVVPLHFSDSSIDPHEIFVKEVDTENTNFAIDGRTLLVLNVPPYVTKAGLKNTFSSDIVKVVLLNKVDEEVEQEHVIGFKVAYIIFKTSGDLDKALESNSLRYVSTSKKRILTGTKKWVTEYNKSIYDHEVLEKQVTSYMRKYDKEEKKRKSSTSNTEDGEGWTLVTKKGRTPVLARKESLDKKLLDKFNKSLDSKCRTNFYIFQKREEKLTRIREMKKQFEDDKKKIEMMKQTRKFKPF